MIPASATSVTPREGRSPACADASQPPAAQTRSRTTAALSRIAPPDRRAPSVLTRVPAKPQSRHHARRSAGVRGPHTEPSPDVGVLSRPAGSAAYVWKHHRRGVVGIVVDLLVGDPPGPARAQRLPVSEVAGEAGMRPARHLDPQPVATAE